MLKRRLTRGAAIVLVVGLAASSAARAAEEESWVGKHVLGKRPDLALKVGEQFGAKVADLPQPMRVEREEGKWLWIDFAGKAGWLKKDDVVPVEQAVDYFSEVIQREPRSAWAYNLRGLVRERQGELQAAIRDFTEALRFDPQLAVAYNNRGIALDRNGEPKRAIEDYREALKLDPNYAAAYNNRGLAWSSLGDDKQAIADFDQAIRLDPKFASARNNRGVAWDKTGDLARAEQDFAAAIGMDPAFAEAYGNRGNISRRQGKYEQALKDFDKAIRLDPANAAAYNNRAWLLATCPDEDHRDGKAAVEAATKACELADWKSPDWLDTLAAAYAASGDFESAIKRQTQAIELAPEPQRADMQSRLELYRAGKPYREAPAK